MDKNLLTINAEQETYKITTFLRETFAKQNIQNVVIGLSGGIDSTVSFYLLKQILPPQHIFPAHLTYFSTTSSLIKQMAQEASIPEENFFQLQIKEAVDACVLTLEQRHSGKSDANRTHPESDSGLARMTGFDKIRLGNIMARMRMIFLYDLAKKNNALVCGTENKSENYLGYFTRFGDQASDIEPIQHLYKTQVYELATYLGVPEEIITAKPTAGLWEGQTDESEFGFTYSEADEVLYYFFEEKLTPGEILKKGYMNAKAIIKRAMENEYKHKTPYSL